MTNIFVFGSNLGGRHGAGSAKFAMQNHGAIYGLGVGLAGSSYAIPTKDCDIKSLPISIIKLYVDQFKAFAMVFPAATFDVVAIGCGLAGFTPEQMAPLFANCPPNVRLPAEFLAVLQP